jgi:ABC-type branched-subunit amino acid transport system substrate-binding protein
MEKMIKMVSLLCLTLLLVSLPLISACGDDNKDKTPAAEEKKITIGHTSALTGYAASSTAPAFQEFTDTIKYINEVEGGVDGIKINLVWADDAFDPAKAAMAYKNLRNRHHPIMWLSLTMDYVVVGAKDMFERDKTPILLYYSMTPELYDPPGMLFALGTSPTNNFTGLVRWILQDWEASGGTGRPKLGYLHWGLPLGTAPLDMGVDRWAEEHGVDFVSRTYTPVPLDLRPQLLGLRDDGVDYVYLQGVSGDVTALVRDSRGAGLWDEMKFIIDATSEAYTVVLPFIREDAEGLYQVRNNEPWSAGPEVAQAVRIHAKMREWAGQSATRFDIAESVVIKQVLTAAVRQAVADVGYEDLSGEAMYNALLKMGPIDTQGGSHWVGYTEDRRIGQSDIKMVQYRKLPPGSEVPPDGIMMETVAVSDWIETTNIFEGEW